MNLLDNIRTHGSVHNLCATLGKHKEPLDVVWNSKSSQRIIGDLSGPPMSMWKVTNQWKWLETDGSQRISVQSMEVYTNQTQLAIGEIFEHGFRKTNCTWAGFRKVWPGQPHAPLRAYYAPLTRSLRTGSGTPGSRILGSRKATVASSLVIRKQLGNSREAAKKQLGNS